MLDRARTRAKGDSRIALQVGDATDLRCLDCSFGFIVCTWLLSHLQNPRHVVAEALERLEPGGTAAFLFFTRPDNLLVGSLVASFVRSFRGTFVEPEAVTSLPHVQTVHRYGSGYATLAVFQRPK